MLKRLITTGAKRYLSFTSVRGFSFIPHDQLKESDHLDQPFLDIYAKRLRKIVLDRTILQKDKLIIPAIRLRQEDDTLEKLRNSKLCAGLISARDEFEDLDIVLESRQMFNIKRRKDIYTQSYYIKVKNELVRCTLNEVNVHYLHNWVIQAKFSRYIPGRPNLLYLPLKMQITKDNRYINKGSEFSQNVKGLWVNCYNDDYPVAIEFNPTTATPGIGYRLGEVANTLPDGVELHSRYNNKLHQFVFRMGLTRDLELENQLEYLEFQRRLKAGELMDVDVEEDEDEKRARETKEAKKIMRRELAKRSTPKNLKKLVAQMNFKVKEGLYAATQEKETKGGQAHKDGG